MNFCSCGTFSVVASLSSKKSFSVNTGGMAKYLNAIVWACRGGLRQWRWGLGQAPGIAELMRAQRREPSRHSSARPPERVASCDDHVGGS